MQFPNHVKLLVPVLLALALGLSACDTFTGAAELDNLETRNAQLQGTIEVLGTPAGTIAALQMTAERSIAMQAELNSVQGTALALQGTVSVMRNGGVPIQSTPAPAPANAAGTPAAVGAPTPGSPLTSFTQTTTSTSIRQADGCADNPTVIFDQTVGQIYVVTRALNLKTGSTISARWLANGSLFFDDTVCWQPPNDYDTICVYCSIVPDGPTFDTGNWSVEMLVDGQMLSQAQFQVVNPQQTGAAQ